MPADDVCGYKFAVILVILSVSIVTYLGGGAMRAAKFAIFTKHALLTKCFHFLPDYPVFHVEHVV